MYGENDKKTVFLGQEKQKQEKVRHCSRCTLSVQKRSVNIIT